MHDTNMKYLGLINDVIKLGTYVTCRGYRCLELLGNRTVIPMAKPLVTWHTRKLGRRFTVAEAAWIMSGDNRVSTIKPYSPMIEKFSDDGLWYFGAYGPRVVEQLPYVVRALERDQFTRQAVMTIWRERPYDTRDVPCTVAVQWFIRDGRLHCMDMMRSSDAWLGVPYDWFNFSMLSAGLAITLRNRGIMVELGDLIFIAGSQHLYVDEKFYPSSKVYDLNMTSPQSDNYDHYDPIDLDEFTDYQDLVDHLWALARRQPTTKTWLSELFNGGRDATK